jgi:tetratricopeptide (TPR) repeat protein
LGVAYIVEGSVRRAGERVRITAQLIAVSDQTHLWAETYERDLKDIFALQNDVAERIAESLTVELLPGAVSTSAQARTIDPEANRAYLQGRFFYWDKRTDEALRTAIKYFQEAARLDPDFALAYAGIADAYAQTHDLPDFSQPEARRIARAAANRALELDDTLAEAHSAHGQVALFLEWDWLTAERAFLKAIELNANYANAHHLYGHLLQFTGRAEDAVKEFERSLELSPSSVQDLGCYANHLVNLGRYTEAETAVARAHEANPSFAYTYVHRGSLHVRRGKLDAALAEFRQAATQSKEIPIYTAHLAFGHAVLGQREEAQELLKELTSQSAHAQVSLKVIAASYVALGDHDEAFSWLEKAYDSRDFFLPWIAVDYTFDTLRGDPRFDDLLRRMGLPSARR